MNTYEAKQEERKERYQKRAAKARTKADQLYTEGNEALKAIPFGQPILVGHHSEKGDRSYRAKNVRKIDKSFEESDKAKYYEQKAESVGKAGISSDDPEAVLKLQEKLTKAQEEHEAMKAHNRKVKGTDEEAFPAYTLTNSNGRIRNIKKRLEKLQKREDTNMKAVVGQGWEMKEDKEENRIMFVFDGKPEEDVRKLLKGRGFKWSPRRGAWVRMITENGRYATKRLIEELKII